MKWAAILLALAPAKHAPQCGPCEASDRAEALIQDFEGYEPFIYRDVAGKETIGFGHLVRKDERFSQPILPDEAEKLLRKDMNRTVDGVNDLVDVELKQNQFDALICFTFNLGTGSLGSSTLLKRVNAERHREVPSQFLRWNKARVDGQLQPVKGLTIRREAEADLYAE